jgi:hypothetical protein
MGRYESQRVITARTISERRHGRKRHGGWAAWFIARIAALLLVSTALVAVAWFTRVPAEPSAPAVVQPPLAKFGKAPLAAKLAEDLAPAPQRARRAHGHRPAPPMAAPELGYQVLSPDELAAISQAD